MAAYISFQPRDHVETRVVVGNGSTQTFTGVPFQPAIVWNKNGDDSLSWAIYDAVRGANNELQCDNTAANSSEVGVTAFTSDGWTVGARNQTNGSGQDIQVFLWKGGTTSEPSGGSLSPTTISYDATSNFYSAKYAGNATSGATIAHGGSKLPTFMIIKKTNSTSQWSVYHKSLGDSSNIAATAVITLNTSSGSADSAGYWNDTSPTTSLITLGSDLDVNGSGSDYIIYSWADTPGYFKTGRYQGNGNADGPFIYTGFRPALVIMKDTSASNSWWCLNDSKNGYNFNNRGLLPSDSSVYQSASSYGSDLLSNGFKHRTSDGWSNQSSKDYIWAAWAEYPFVSSNSISATAR